VAKVQRVFSAAGRSGMGMLVRLLDVSDASYLIGAGVSSERVPIGPDLGRAVAGEWLRVGIYDADLPPHGELFSALGLDSLFDPYNLSSALMSRIYDNSVTGILYLLFSRANRGQLPPGYQLFRRLPRPLAIYNMNVDGLASRLACPGITVFNLHGTVAGGVDWASADNAELAGQLIEAGIPLPGSSRIWYPRPEPDGLTKVDVYQRVAQRFKRAKCVFVLGYSFGARGSTFDDVQTFGLLCEQATANRTPIVVLNLDPTPLVDLLSTTVANVPVAGIALDWHRFSRALLSLPMLRSHHHLPLVRAEDDLYSQYCALLDREELDRQ
jgi:hypothetical protein